MENNKITNSRRLLLIDDQPDVVESLAMCLKLAGHEVITAYTAMTGIASASNFKPDIIFLDIGLPDLDGYQTAKKLRSLPQGGQFKIIALSGYPQDPAVTQDFDLYLIKPPNLSHIQKVIAEWRGE